MIIPNVFDSFHFSGMFMMLPKFFRISFVDVPVAHDYSLHGGNISPPKVLQFGKTRKLSVDQFDPRK
jgi:hypothetical protein